MNTALKQIKMEKLPAWMDFQKNSGNFRMFAIFSQNFAIRYIRAPVQINGDYQGSTLSQRKEIICETQTTIGVSY